MVKLSNEQIVELQKKIQEIVKLPQDEQSKKINELLSPKEIEFLKERQASKQECIFCKIAKHERQTRVIYEDDLVMAFLDIKPASPGHVIVIPKEHVAVLPQLPDELCEHYFKIVKKLSAAVFEAMGAHGVNILQNNGAAAGQAVNHLYTYIIPRFEKDELHISEWNPMSLAEEQFAEIQKRISEKVENVVQKKVLYDERGQVIEEKKESGAPKKPKEIFKVKGRLP